VQVVRVTDEREEAETVAEAMQQAAAEGLPWREMAVLYRMNALSRAVEDALRRRGVPYRIVRGTAFYARKEVRDLLAYLRLALNPADDAACGRIVNTPPRAIGDASMARVERAAAARGMPLLAALALAREAGVADRTARRMDEFAQMVARWRAMLDEAPPEALAAFADMVLTESGLREWSEGGADEDLEERRANLDEVVSAAGEHSLAAEPADAAGGDARPPRLRDALASYLQSVALVADTDALDPVAGAVTLMTLHAAKGLEYAQVAVVGCEEGLLPHARSAADEEELEEERRLLFVGMTRAKRRLLLVHAAHRSLRGFRMATMESAFLRELPEASVVRTDRARDRDMTDLNARLAAPEPRGRGAAGFAPGTPVRHPMFGVGTVQAVQLRGSVTSVKVAFRTVGVKTLVLEYARLERLGG
jgi:DNA helicase-2/ATP-dependent DNA helicase PcrA